jgi:hypothetical protein
MRLRGQPVSEHLFVGSTMQECLSELDRQTPPTIARLWLQPVPAASRAARDFVSRTCLDWGVRHGVGSACLVVSEFVTNVVLHALTDMEVCLALHGRRLRLAVRDHSSQQPVEQPGEPQGVNGRGLILVDWFSRAWGMLPAADGGKVAWAVLDV